MYVPLCAYPGTAFCLHSRMARDVMGPCPEEYDGRLVANMKGIIP